MTPVNVLIFEPYPFGKVAGNLRTLSYILDLVDKKRFKLYLVVPFESDFTHTAPRCNVECVLLRPPQRLLRYGRQCLRDNLLGKCLTVFQTIRYNLELFAFIRKKKIDVIYSNGIRALLSVALAAKVSRVPLLWYVKGTLQNPFLDRVGFVLANRILFFCDSNKRDKYPTLVKTYRHKIGILKIGIDTEHIRTTDEKDKTSLRHELSIDPLKVNLVYAGQLYPPKGIHHLLHALAIVVRRFPDVMLYIVGHHIVDTYAGYWKQLYQILKQNSLEDKVVFTGWRTDALAIISVMDVLVHPTLFEGFGRAVLEAMALGKPVVASRVGGLREAIKDGDNGFLVDPGDPQALANKLLTLVHDDVLRKKLGQAAKETVASEYLIHDKIAQLENVWASLALGECART